MAFLKDTVISGSLRATDAIYSTTNQFKILKIPNSSGGTNYTTGDANNLIKSNGSSVYWATLAASDIPSLSTDKLTSGTLGAARGGTGQSTYTVGDILYCGTANSLSKLGIGTAGYFLKATSSGPAWANTTDITTLGTITSGTWQGTAIGANYGGTGQTSLKNSANALLSNLDTATANMTSAGYIITSDASNPADNLFYRRTVDKVVNATLVKAALGTDSAKDSFLRKDGTWASALTANITVKHADGARYNVNDGTNLVVFFG